MKQVRPREQSEFLQQVRPASGPSSRGTTTREGFSSAEIRDVLSKGGALSFGQLMHCRVAYFSTSVAFGSRKFVEGLEPLFRETSGLKHKREASSLANQVRLPRLPTIFRSANVLYQQPCPQEGTMGVSPVLEQAVSGRLFHFALPFFAP